MNKRIAIGAAIALLASLAFATVASASDGFEDGDYTIFLTDATPVEFTITDGDIVTGEALSDSDDETRITFGQIEIEIDADDARIRISGLTSEEAAKVTMAFEGQIYTQANLPDDWELTFDGDGLTDDSASDDVQTNATTGDDSNSTDDDTLSDDDDSVGDDTASDDDDSVDTQTTTATIGDDSDSTDDDSISTDDDSVSDDSDSTDDDSDDDSGD